MMPNFDFFALLLLGGGADLSFYTYNELPPPPSPLVSITQPPDTNPSLRAQFPASGLKPILEAHTEGSV